MNKETFKAFLITLIAINCVVIVARTTATAHHDINAQERQKESGGSVSINNQSGRISIKLERGSKIALSNRFGRITISGWDHDTVEATATSEKGPEAVSIEMTADPSTRSKISLSVPGHERYREHYPEPRPRPAPAPRSPSEPIVGPIVISPGIIPPIVITPKTSPRAERSRNDNGIHLDVKVPRYAELEEIEARMGDVTVTGIDGPVTINSGSSNINVSRVGALEVRSRSGNVSVEDVNGLIYVVATSGKISVARAGGDVHAVSINGDINVRCAKGRVEASNARGSITLAGIGGDVEASTTNGDVSFTGPIRSSGRYRMKSMSGGVQMAVPDGAPGFTATLASYNSEVVTDFPVRDQSIPPGAMVNRRIIARYGDGQAQIALDSFSRNVRLTKAASSTLSTCK